MTNTGQIVKTKTELPFTQIPNSVLRDKTLSARAKGLLCFMLSLPADWVLYKSNIHENFTEGKEAIATAWDELVKAGYILSVRMIGENNMTTGWNHVVYFEPTVAEIPMNTDVPPYIGFSDIREPVHPKTTPYTKKETSTNKEKIFDDFENFRKLYPGTKRGYATEFDEFKKKHKDYKEVLPLLIPALQNWTLWMQQQAATGGFVPDSPHLKTWLFQRRWETEYQVKPATVDTLAQYESLKTKGFENCNKEEIEAAYDYQHRTLLSYSEFPPTELLVKRGYYVTRAEADARR